MKWYRLRRWLREWLGVLPTLDLHGCGVREALEHTQAFLRQARDLGELEVRIVYGKGRRSPGGQGVLREVIPRWLEQAEDLVESYERLPDASGADGSARVRIRPKRS